LKEVLSVASVEGEEFTAEVIARVLAKNERELVHQLSRELEKKHHLIAAQGIRRLESGEQRLSSYRFRHNLFRSYIYLNLDEVEQSYWHEAIGNVMEQIHAQQLESIVVQLAQHFEKAGLSSKAIKYWMKAGDAAARVYANAEAIVSYRRALALTRHHEASSNTLAQLYAGLGRAFELTNQFDQALSKYRDLEELAQRRNDLTLELTALMAQITLHAVPGPLHDPTRGQALGENALTLANDLGDQAAEAKILWNLLLVNIYNNNMPQAITYGERSLALARKLNLQEQVAYSLNDLAGCYWVLGRFDQAKEAVGEAQSLWREFGNRPMLADSLHISTLINIRIGEYNRAIALSEEGYKISLSDDNLWGQSSSRFRLGYVYWERGQIEKAITIMEETIHQSEQIGFQVPSIVTRTELAAVYGSLGATERGLELVRLALKIASEHMPLYQAFVLGHLAQLLLLNDNLEEAEKSIDRARSDSGRHAWPVYYLPVRFADSWLALKSGDHEQALAKTDQLLADIRQYGMRSEIPGSLHLQSQALLGLGQRDTARERLIEARREAESIGSRRTMWQILEALSKLESDPSKTEQMRQQSQEIIKYIARHINDQKLRTLFLDLPQVKDVLQ
jgi:tetratricopeptide (TPR) repeat protein